MTLKLIGFVICLLSGLALGIKHDPTGGRLSPYTPSQQSQKFKQEIDQLLAATNQVRLAKRRTSLQQDPKLMAAAQQYAERMAAKDELSHTIDGLRLPDKAQQVGYAYRRLSENIAYNTVLNARFVVNEQWMKSKGHRQNLLADDVSQIGIGIAGPSKRTNRYYYCQIFGQPLVERAP